MLNFLTPKGSFSRLLRKFEFWGANKTSFCSKEKKTSYFYSFLSKTKVEEEEKEKEECGDEEFVEVGKRRRGGIGSKNEEEVEKEKCDDEEFLPLFFCPQVDFFLNIFFSNSGLVYEGTR